MSSTDRWHIRTSMTLALGVTLLAACGPAAVPSQPPPSTSAAATTQPVRATPVATAPAEPVDTIMDGVPARTLNLGKDAAPIDVTFAFGSIWVANHHANTAVRVDPVTLVPQAAPIKVDKGPGWFVVTDDALFLSRQTGRGMARIDPATNTAAKEAGFWPPCWRGVFAFGSVWQPACDAGQVMRIDPATLLVNDVTADGYWSVAVDGPTLLLGGQPGLARLDPRTNKIKPLGGPSGAIVGLDGTTAWLLSDTASMARVDTTDPGHVVELPVFGDAQVAFRDGHAWVVNERSLLEMDLATSKVLRTIHLDMPATGIHVSADAIWITSYAWDSIIRLAL